MFQENIIIKMHENMVYNFKHHHTSLLCVWNGMKFEICTKHRIGVVVHNLSTIQLFHHLIGSVLIDDQISPVNLK